MATVLSMENKYNDEEVAQPIQIKTSLGTITFEDALEDDDDFDDDDEEYVYENYSNWIETKGNYAPAINVSVVKKMKAGVYRLGILNDQVNCMAQKLSSDGLCLLPDSTSTLILEETEEFWKKADDFKKYNMIHKRGILLEGKPGTGRRL